MDDRFEGRGQPYQDVLVWLRTATVEEIQGALAISWGLSRDDLERGIRHIITMERPGLASMIGDPQPSTAIADSP